MELKQWIMDSKILIFGGSGLVGSTLVNYAKNKFKIHITYNENNPLISNISSNKIDFISKTSKLENLIKTINPDYVVNTVAHPSIDFCEKNPQVAETLHVDAVKAIADASKDANSKLISFSTDAVFDGKKNGKYSETDITNPMSHYGRTKLEGEKIVLNTSNKNTILRTTVIYGWNNKSRFTNWVIDSIIKKQKVTAFVDQFNTPTLADDLAKAILKIIDKNIGGLFNAVGSTCLSRYEFAMKIAKKFDLDQNNIIQSKPEEIDQIGLRPKNGCLDNSKIEHALDFQFCNIDQGISFMHAQKLN